MTVTWITSSNGHEGNELLMTSVRDSNAKISYYLLFVHTFSKKGCDQVIMTLALDKLC